MKDIRNGHQPVESAVHVYAETTRDAERRENRSSGNEKDSKQRKDGTDDGDGVFHQARS